MLRSVRARTTLGATAVVAGALIVAGLAVVLLLRADLAGRADLQSEVAAREVASQLATGVTGDRLDLPDPEDHPVLVVDASGRVRAADKDLRDVGGVPVRPSARIPPGGDDHGDDDDDDSRPGRGQVSPDVDFSTATATVDGRTAEFRFASVRVSTPAGETLTVRAGASLATTREAVGTVARAMLVGLPVLLAVVAGVTWLVTRRALGPVEAIRAQMAAITASGDLTRRVPEPGSRDEVADLAVTTNATLAALEESVGRQRGFVADASHELRSPIASLRTQLEVALAHPELLDLEGVVEDVVRLQHLAADLLLLARLDAGDRPAPSEARPVDLAELVEEEVARRSAGPAGAAAGRPVPVVEAVIEAAPRVAGPRGRVARVLGNLLDNARRHAEGVVRVTLREEDGTAVLGVADDGPGVPPGDRERIFERFVRLDDARSRDEGGAGLGLAIARDLVRAQSGTLTVGGAPGGGALFEVRLPVSGGSDSRKG
ncbi:HAMP domain-containing sensor histidine kinase [Actinomadura viridis]|uniref:histidine kinase n=1 Tax=Actinomadura viridis TaxID=58110 RepID=A0A931DPD2_9ACTN|nr:HAMP domain-containing sensor histidine kinase [Actinomadura viridis]MBG6093352.1 signal transduction histidine kinase [Actinomadura viridis]